MKIGALIINFDEKVHRKNQGVHKVSHAFQVPPAQHPRMACAADWGRVGLCKRLRGQFLVWVFPLAFRSRNNVSSISYIWVWNALVWANLSLGCCCFTSSLFDFIIYWRNYSVSNTHPNMDYFSWNVIYLPTPDEIGFEHCSVEPAISLCPPHVWVYEQEGRCLCCPLSIPSNQSVLLVICPFSCRSDNICLCRLSQT